MSVSHVSQDEPTRVDVWTVLKELPQRVQALLKHHEASQELGFEGPRAGTPRAVHACRVCGDERGAGAPGWGARRSVGSRHREKREHFSVSSGRVTFLRSSGAEFGPVRPRLGVRA